MKRYGLKKNVIGIICPIMLLFFVVLCGCKKDTKDDEVISSLYTYTPVEIDIEKDTSVYASCYKDGSIYYVSRNYAGWDEIEEEDAAELSDEVEVYKYDCNEGKKTFLFKIADPQNIELIKIDSDGLINIIHQSDGSISASLAKYTESGEKVFKKELIYNNNGDNSYSDETGISYCSFGNDGAVYMVADIDSKQVIKKYDSGANCVCSIPYENYADDITVDGDNNIVAITSADNGLKCNVFDVESCENIKSFAIENEDDKYLFGRGEIHGGTHDKFVFYGLYGGDSYYVKDVDGLYKYNPDSGEMSLLFNWIETGLIGRYVKDLELLPDGRLICISQDDLLNTTFGFIKKEESPKVKTVIKCAALYPDGNYGQALQKNIIEYNRLHDDVYVKYIGYEKSSNPISAFARDVISGSLPDIIDISSVDVENYANKGLFADLTPFMEKDDVLNKDYFVDGLLDAVAINNCQYFIMKGFKLDTVVGKKSDMERFSGGWNVQDMIDYYNSKPQGTQLYMNESKEDIFDRFIAGTLQDYINKDTGEVDFKNGDFSKMLEFCKGFPDFADYGVDYNDVREKIKEGQILLNATYITPNHEYKLNKKLFDGDFVYLGYPSNDGGNTYIIPEEQSLAISETSDHKDEAWDFIKFVTTKKTETSYGFPSGKADFDRLIRRLTATEKYIDEDGNKIMPLDGDYGWNNLEVSVNPYSMEDIEIIKELIAKGRLKTNSQVLADIVRKELQGYYRGKSLDEVIDIIEDRVTKYVNEML